jgi:hypothetical protein
MVTPGGCPVTPAHLDWPEKIMAEVMLEEKMRLAKEKSCGLPSL